MSNPHPPAPSATLGTASASASATPAVSPNTATSARSAAPRTTVHANAPPSLAENSLLDADDAPLAASLPAAIYPHVPLDAVDFPAATPPTPALPFRIVTPLKADAWHSALDAAGLLPKYSFILDGLLLGFDIGLSRASVDSFFANSPLPYQVYPNHAPALRYPEIIDAMFAEELAEGRVSGPFKPDELHATIGAFRNAPLTVAAKDGDYSKGRVCQDFSHPRNDPDDPSFNAGINQDDFVCDWGTFARCYLLAARAPEGTEVAVFDVKAAHRRIPVQPWQQGYCTIAWKGDIYLNHCVQFGEASASGLWGQLADGFRGIFRARFTRDDVLNWADDFTFWRYALEAGGYDISEDDIYALGDELGWPWSPKKTRPFSHAFPYLGFDWDLRTRMVVVSQKKIDKYLRVMEEWTPGAVFRATDAQSLLGKLVHCSMVILEGRSRLPALSKFAAKFANDHVTRTPGNDVLEDIQWWREKLGGPFPGMLIKEIPPPAATSLYVDASTSWGIGIVLNGEWDHWKLVGDWKTSSRDIGWAEMVAVEFGLRAAVEAGAENVHLIMRSDNTGVVGALDGGKSRNLEVNKVLRRVVTHMMQHNIWMTTRWVASEDNIADAPSRGMQPGSLPRRKFLFRVPYPIKDWVQVV